MKLRSPLVVIVPALLASVACSGRHLGRPAPRIRAGGRLRAASRRADSVRAISLGARTRDVERRLDRHDADRPHRRRPARYRTRARARGPRLLLRRLDAARRCGAGQGTRRRRPARRAQGRARGARPHERPCLGRRTAGRTPRPHRGHAPRLPARGAAAARADHREGARRPRRQPPRTDGGVYSPFSMLRSLATSLPTSSSRSAASSRRSRPESRHSRQTSFRRSR